jgi:hypothetical protein
MSIPAETKRVQVIDRIVEVLGEVGSGASYFKTPASVSKRYTHWKEVLSGPAYSVSLDSGGKITDGTNHQRTEEFYVNVKGVVLDEYDAVTEIAHCLRDVRYAIDQDMQSTASGSLGNLCAALFFDEGAETDNGYLSLEGQGQFEQRIRIVITGTIGTL